METNSQNVFNGLTQVIPLKKESLSLGHPNTEADKEEKTETRNKPRITRNVGQL